MNKQYTLLGYFRNVFLLLGVFVGVSNIAIPVPSEIAIPSMLAIGMMLILIEFARWQIGKIAEFLAEEDKEQDECDDE